MGEGRYVAPCTIAVFGIDRVVGDCCRATSRDEPVGLDSGNGGVRMGLLDGTDGMKKNETDH